jgi:DNA repair protein RecO (recombination protein O)
MQWSDDGIVLGCRKHGESGVILELMTREYGRHLGLVHGGRSRRLQPVLQPGNTVHAVWRARLDEHLGTYAVEGGDMRSARLIASPLALYGVAAMAALLRLLPERDSHPALFESATVLLEHLDEPAVAPGLFIRFELAVLAELGFGLDLARCAATGVESDLIYVSPKSGRAVSAAAGEPYKGKLLPLPRFLRRAPRPDAVTPDAPSRDDIKAGFALTGYFLNLHVFEPSGTPPPEERARFVTLSLLADG